MNKRGDQERLQDILDAIDRIELYMRGVNEAQLRTDTMLQDAIVLRIGIVGEATRNISPDLRKQYPEIPWLQVVGMEKRIVGKHFKTDSSTLLKTVKKDLPPLKRAVAKLVKQVKG